MHGFAGITDARGADLIGPTRNQAPTRHLIKIRKKGVSQVLFFDPGDISLTALRQELLIQTAAADQIDRFIRKTCQQPEQLVQRVTNQCPIDGKIRLMR